MREMSPPPGQVPDLVARVAAGDREAIVELLARYRDRLRRMVALRLDPRLRGRVAECHRRHLSRPGRDVGREVSIYRGAMPGVSSGALAARLLGKLTSPSQAVIRAERKLQLQVALNC